MIKRRCQKGQLKARNTQIAFHIYDVGVLTLSYFSPRQLELEEPASPTKIGGSVFLRVESGKARPPHHHSISISVPHQTSAYHVPLSLFSSRYLCLRRRSDENLTHPARCTHHTDKQRRQKITEILRRGGCYRFIAFFLYIFRNKSCKKKNSSREENCFTAKTAYGSCARCLIMEEVIGPTDRASKDFL